MVGALPPPETMSVGRSAGNMLRLDPQLNLFYEVRIELNARLHEITHVVLGGAHRFTVDGMLSPSTKNFPIGFGPLISACWAIAFHAEGSAC